jgi:hypothetical protein
MRAERVHDGVQFAVIQFGAARFGPRFGFVGSMADRLSRSVQHLFGMVTIQDLSGLGK